MKKLSLFLLSLFLVSCTTTNWPTNTLDPNLIPTANGPSVINPAMTKDLDGSTLLTEYSDFSLAGKKATLYKSKNCGCCEGYAEALRKAWVEVTVVPDNAKLK
jgi:hypothetical protein